MVIYMYFSELGVVTVRAIASFITLFLVTKLIGKKQISELSLFDYVIGISIGNFSAEMIINTELNPINGILAIILFGLFAYIISVATMKSIKIRRFFAGTPTMIIQNGKLISENMSKVKLDINDLLEQLRIKGYFDISEIEYAVMEANGILSILQKEPFQPITKEDMKLKSNKSSLIANIIIDGKVMENNLRILNKSKEWLDKQIKIQGYNDISKILLATLNNQQKITIYEKNNSIESLNILE